MDKYEKYDLILKAVGFAVPVCFLFQHIIGHSVGTFSLPFSIILIIVAGVLIYIDIKYQFTEHFHDNPHSKEYWKYIWILFACCAALLIGGLICS